MEHQPQRVQLLSTQNTPEKMDPTSALEIEEVRKTVEGIKMDTKQMLMSLKQEQSKTAEFFASQLRHLRDACLEPAESSAYRLVVENAERNAAILSKSEAEIHQAHATNKEKLSSILVKAKLLKETILLDTSVAEKEIADREELKVQKQELKLKSKIANEKRQENIERIKELNRQEKQEGYQREQEKREHQIRLLSELTKKSEEAATELKQKIKIAEEVDRKRQLRKRVTKPTPASRAAAKSHLSYHKVLQAPQQDPPRQFFSRQAAQQESTDSDEEPPKKLFYEVLISPSKKLASRVMVPTPKQKDKKH
ncbi:unnamed protein product [Caenorhabditis brenneri]